MRGHFLRAAAGNGGGGGASLLLDAYPGADAAYSLRQLRTGVTSVVRVRRSSDNAQADFTAAEVSDGTLTGWVGANDGFVTRWYDQSADTSSYIANESITSQQPAIVLAGVPQTSNGLPAINWQSQGNYLRSWSDGSGWSGAITSLFSVHQASSATPAYSHILRDVTISSTIVAHHGDFSNWISSTFAATEVRNGSHYINGGGVVNLATTARTFNQMLISLIHTAPIIVPRFSVGSNGDNRALRGLRQELILYPDDRATDLDGIRDNINAYYSIF